jgi:methionyl-tRNA formyltransferase
MRVFISGQKYFGAEVLRVCLNMGFEVVGVCAPFGDRYLRPLAELNNIPVMNAGSLSKDTCPRDIDLGITAHSFDYIGHATRMIPRLGWIGYHPSLLPRHRGRSAVEWALKMRDFATGGTVYWLNAGIDRGDIERQEIVWVDPAMYSGDIKKNAADIWREELLPLGVKLIRGALTDIKKGVYNRAVQDARFSTFEPSTDVKDIFKPDLLGIGPGAINTD